MAVIQDSVFTLATVDNCEYITSEDGFVYKKVLLKLNDDGENKFHIKTMEFLINERKKQVKKVHIDYTDDHRISETTVSFNAIDFDHKSEKFEKRQLIYSSIEKGSIPDTYKDYQVIDTRVRK